MVDLSNWNNLIVFFLAPIYLCAIFYSISYGFFKGAYYWYKDFEVFQSMLHDLDVAEEQEVVENESKDN